MEQLVRFVSKKQLDHVCRLNKTLYILKQTLRARFYRLTQTLHNFGFTSSLPDTSLFITYKSSTHIFVLSTWMTLLSGGLTCLLSTLWLQICKLNLRQRTWAIYHIVFDIHVQHKNKSLHLNQSKYILNFFDKVSMLGAKPYSIPCISGKRLSKFDRDPQPYPTIYRHIVEALQYCTFTRSVTFFSIN